MSALSTFRKEKSANLHWVAEYFDGSTLTEKDVSYGNLKRDGLTAFGLFDENDKPVTLIQLSKDKVLFYRMRVILDISGSGSQRLYLLGYRTVKGKTQLTVIDSDGKSKNHGAFAEAKLHEIEFYPQEQI
jgi:hypothetical protein